MLEMLNNSRKYSNKSLFFYKEETILLGKKFSINNT